MIKTTGPIKIKMNNKIIQNELFCLRRTRFNLSSTPGFIKLTKYNKIKKEDRQFFINKYIGWLNR